MDRSRVLILGLAAVVAIVAALVVRGLAGGGTPKAVAAIAPRPVATENVLVAASDVRAGAKLTPAMVKWESWPESAVSRTYITSRHPEDLAHIIQGTVARVPMIAGEPLSTLKIVHADAAGFMSAQIGDGLRAVSIQISDQTGGAGFVLPGDRVDVLLSRGANDGGTTKTILTDVRVLAIGQTAREGRDEKTVSGKTATLEVSPPGAEQLARASVLGVVTLSLRPLIDNGNLADAGNAGVAVIRYGAAHGPGGQAQD